MKPSLQDQCSVLEQAINAIAPIYNADSINERQKALLETMIGAAIFYLPGKSELYSGWISKRAWESLLDGNKKLTEEHRYPRKLAGKQLLSLAYQNFEEPGRSLQDLYLKEYGVFNLVLAKENNELRKHQKEINFINIETCYSIAGIQLIEKSMQEIKDYIKANRKNNLIKMVPPLL